MAAVTVAILAIGAWLLLIAVVLLLGWLAQRAHLDMRHAPRIVPHYHEDEPTYTEQRCGDGRSDPKARAAR